MNVTDPPATAGGTDLIGPIVVLCAGPVLLRHRYRGLKNTALGGRLCGASRGPQQCRQARER